jgi:phosphatidylglycerophosphate synthase
VISRRLIAWLPNLITLARILAVPVIVYVMLFGHYTAALWIFVAAAVTDALDGAIAKQFSVESEVGAFLDPLADKALLLGVYVLLGYTGHIATWLVILVVFRDFLIIAGAIMFYRVLGSGRAGAGVRSGRRCRSSGLCGCGDHFRVGGRLRHQVEYSGGHHGA